MDGNTNTEKRREYRTRPQDDFDFLKSLPTEFQHRVRDLAHQRGWLYSDAYDALVRQEVDEAIEERSNQHSP